MVLRVQPGWVINIETTSSRPSMGVGGTLPLDRWVCAELQVELGQALGSARLYLDGALTLEADKVPTQFTVDMVRAGVVSGTKNGVLRLNVDEVVIDDKPIGCE